MDGADLLLDAFKLMFCFKFIFCFSFSFFLFFDQLFYLVLVLVKVLEAGLDHEVNILVEVVTATFAPGQHSVLSLQLQVQARIFANEVVLPFVLFLVLKLGLTEGSHTLLISPLKLFLSSLPGIAFPHNTLLPTLVLVFFSLAFLV